MNTSAVDQLVVSYSRLCEWWDHDILPVLENYIRIPNQSPYFDPEWQAHGFMQEAMQLLLQWVQKQPIQNLQCRLLEEPGRTPLLYIEVAGTTEDTVLFYGHMDKQPPLQDWDKDLGPWKPVLKDDKLYGRGAADDGYALFAALTALRLVQEQKQPHARCVILIEACEESGSEDLPHYLETLSAQIGVPKLIIALDSGCGDYERLWSTTSLRGNVTGTLQIKVLREGIHSGKGSGAVPNPFLILRQLLSRIEDEHTGAVLLPECQWDIPAQSLEQAQQTACILKASLSETYPLLSGVRLFTEEAAELLLNSTWRAALSITGLEGLPPLQAAGNVSIPALEVKLSLRTPPSADANEIARALKATLEKDPPFGAHIQVNVDHVGSGWQAPLLEPWLHTACAAASKAFFGQEAAYLGEGGSIPFMAMLGKKFPQAQFLITGVLGPHSNAHGPNEFLHLPTAKKLTGCIAAVLVLQTQRL